MDDMIKGFIEEVNEMLHQLENDLIALEKRPGDKDIINKIFRVMHTLKGSAGMCGFKNIQELTHAFEDVYEKIRENQITVNSEIIDLTLKGKDHIARMLANNDNAAETAELIRSLIHDHLTGSDSEEKSEPDAPASDVSTYFILLSPDKEVFERGINPDKTIEEIKSAGSAHIIPHSGRKSWKKQKDEKACQTKWEIYLASSSLDTGGVEDIFLFYDESEYKVIDLSSGNMKENKMLLSSLQSIYKGKKDISFHLEEVFDKLPIQETKMMKQQVIDANNEMADKGTDQMINETDSTISVSSRKLDELMNLVSELVTLTATLEVFSTEIKSPKLKNTIENVEKLTKKFRNNALDLRLVPVGTLLSKFKRQVRDLSKELNKDVNLIIEGQDIEIDKTILKAIEKPLQHILRNSLDHGIESENERVAKGKSPAGLLKIAAFYSGANVLLQVQDDGNGINLERVRECAISKGYIQPDQTVTDQELINLTMEPGFTTTDNITIVSGRGVGMDVVKKELSRVGGSLEVFTEKDLGTSVTMKLPTTLTIIDTLMVDVNSTRILIPMLDIEYCYQDSSKALFKKDNRYIQYKNKPIPVVSLRQKFKYNDYDKDDVMVIVINKFENQYAIVADHIVGEYQAVIKPLGELFGNQPYFSGGSIMVDGKLSLILDTNFLFNQTIRNKN